MSNCIILGAARSGTSMATGVLRQAGYFMGNNLCPADSGNPKGYFEDRDINGINEELLAQVTPGRPAGILGRVFFRKRPIHGQRWLVRVPVNTVIPTSPEMIARIKTLTQQEPFCFKDPRFCYTLPVWRPFMKNVVFVCVFRHPAETAHSLLKEARRDSRNRGIRLDLNCADVLELWELMYRHIVEVHYPLGGRWLFAHFNQFLDGSIFKSLYEKIDRKIDSGFVDSTLKHFSTNGVMTPKSVLSMYHQLCRLADYQQEII